MKSNKMNITFIGGIFPPQNIDFFKEHSKGIFQYAADVMQKNIIRGLQNNTHQKLNIITLPFVGTFPNSCDLKYIHKHKFDSDVFSGTQVGFNNTKFINEFSKYKALKKEIIEQFSINKKPLHAVVIYGMFPFFLKITSFIKKKFPDVRICMIVPDLPHLMGGDNTKLHIKMYNRYIKGIVDNNISNVDAFVFISKYMEDYLKTSKPYDILEGIYNTDEKEIVAIKEISPTIFYSGTLALRYGIEKLLKSFSLIENPELRLWICGAGDGEEKVKEYAEKDSRIIFKGQLDRLEILKLQRKATILINPRDAKEDFTKYSFPSKTIEYLSSGTPTILYKLAGIPEEYYNYCFICEENGTEGLKNLIVKVLELPEEIRNNIGEKAKSFIITQKNETLQSLKIINLINRLS